MQFSVKFSSNQFYCSSAHHKILSRDSLSLVDRKIISMFLVTINVKQLTDLINM